VAELLQCRLTVTVLLLHYWMMPMLVLMLHLAAEARMWNVPCSAGVCMWSLCVVCANECRLMTLQRQGFVCFQLSLAFTTTNSM